MRRQRGHAEEGACVEGEASRGCRAACVAGAWRPRGECRLTRLGTVRRNRRGVARSRPDVARGRPDARSGLGRGERRVWRQAEPASAVG